MTEGNPNAASEIEQKTRAPRAYPNAAVIIASMLFQLVGLAFLLLAIPLALISSPVEVNEPSPYQGWAPILIGAVIAGTSFGIAGRYWRVSKFFAGNVALIIAAVASAVCWAFAKFG